MIRLALLTLTLLTTACGKNTAPVAEGAVPTQSLVAGETITVNVASAFSDPDGDALTYAAASSDLGVANVAVSGTTPVTGVSAGTATVTVTDPEGLSASIGVPVTVEPSLRAVCERTPQVRDEIVRVTGAANCDAVTEQDLSGISGSGVLDLGDADITALREGDFAGLSSLESLRLGYNDRTTLADGVFAGRSSLQSPRSEDNPGSPFELALARTGSWCTVQQTESLSFRLEENGKTVSLCEDGDVLQYTFGTLGEVPELVYSGPILGRARGFAVLWGEGVFNLTELVDAADQQNALWEVESGARQLRRLSESRETNGFFVVFGMTGLVSETVYVFRRGGWEYAIVSRAGRPFNLFEDELEEYESGQIVMHSPSGQVYVLR